jgi:soluble lytic murein transglycosylase-like protein
MADAMIAIIVAAALRAGVPPVMELAVCTQESNLRPRAVNVQDGGSASYGLCQIKSSTAKMLGFRSSPEFLLDPEHNAAVGAAYLRRLLNNYGSDHNCAIAAFNAGICRHTWHGQIRNLRYVKAVLERERNYTKAFTGVSFNGKFSSSNSKRHDGLLRRGRDTSVVGRKKRKQNVDNFRQWAYFRVCDSA